MPEVFVGVASDFDSDVRKGVTIEGREVFVFKHRDRFYAYENRCPHSGGPVGEGTIIGRVTAVLGEDRELVREDFSEEHFNIVCPWHGYEYDIDTGQCAGDARIKLRKFTVVEREDGIYVS